MHRQHYVIGVAFALSLILIGCRTSETPTTETTPYLEAAVQVGEWLRSFSIEGDGGVVPDELSSPETTASLASGAAGRALFFAELYTATKDRRFRESAMAAAHAAIESLPTDNTNFGLYGGSAGVAVALNETARATGNTELRFEALRLFRQIVEEAEITVGEARWTTVNDVLAGKAGIGLALIYAYEEFAEPHFLSAAILAGEDLLFESEVVAGGGIRWFRGRETPFDLPNFSHGTAGVGFFMARLSAASGMSVFNEAAKNAARYLDHVADTTDGLYLVPYGIPNDGYVTPYDIGWAHGPAGTVRIHFALWGQTGDEQMKSRVDASARTLLATGAPGPSANPDLWTGPFKIDQRFGISGAASFLADWSIVASDSTYLNAAMRMNDHILSKASSDQNGLYWTLPLYGFQGEGEGTYTGYFYGAAGLGISLLRQHYAMNNQYPTVRLPDDPFPRGIN